MLLPAYVIFRSYEYLIYHLLSLYYQIILPFTHLTNTIRRSSASTRVNLLFLLGTPMEPATVVSLSWWQRSSFPLGEPPCTDCFFRDRTQHFMAWLPCPLSQLFSASSSFNHCSCQLPPRLTLVEESCLRL